MKKKFKSQISNFQPKSKSKFKKFDLKLKIRNLDFEIS